MHIIEKNLKKAEKYYSGDNSGENALALFGCYVLAGKTIDGEGAYLSKAFHVAVTAHHDDLLDLKIITAVLHANILLENYESAYELIKALDSHSSFLSKNMPLYYGQILYFYSIVQLNFDKVRSAKKIHRNLEILYEKTGITELLAYLASLQWIVFDDVELCAKMYLEAVLKGANGVFLYLDIYEMLLREEEYTQDMNQLSKVIIPWALNKDIPIGSILKRLEKRTLIGILFSLSTRHLAKVYLTYGHSGAFQCLCQKLIYVGDTSEKALSYYETALKNRMDLRGLIQISVRAAFYNNFYGLPLYTVEGALNQPVDYEPELLAFMFSVILNQTESIEAIGEQQEKIIKFGFWAHSKGYRGKHFNTVYKYIYQLYPEDTRFLEIMSEELFKYEIRFKGQAPCYVCAYEYAKEGVEQYEVKDGKCCINSLGGFELYFLGQGGNEYLNINGYSITKTLVAEGAELMEAIYEQGYHTPNLIIALAMKYMAGKDFDKKKLDVLQKATGLVEISKNLLIDICAALAEYYAKEEQYSLAIHYYTFIGEDKIKPRCLAGALNTYIATGRYENALSLITKRCGAFSDGVIFEALKVLYEKADTPEIALVCYNLILKDLCSAEILNIVMRKFKGTTEEWLKLAIKIDSLGFDVSQLYERIIVNGIFIGSIGNDCDEAFIKLYHSHKEHPIILKYAYFCCYEVIRNEKQLSEELAEVLEDMYYERGEDKLLCYALAITHIKNGRHDKAAAIGEAAAYLEEDDMILPSIKEYQDKNFVSSYIEKHTPFVYYQAPYKNVSICYKTDDMPAYVKKPLKYFKFGIYTANLALFFGEKVTYYFEEENGAKSELLMFVNNHMRLVEQFEDPYYTINNLIIYEHMMKFDMAEDLMEAELLNNERFDVLIL